jgi:choline-sulfatase
LAGIPIPQTVQFPSLAPLLHGGDQPLHDAVFSYYIGFQRMVRTKMHRLIVYPKIRRIQVFDIEHDPWEKHDLSNDPASAKVKADLLEHLKRLQLELGDNLNLNV